MLPKISPTLKTLNQICASKELGVLHHDPYAPEPNNLI
jgi:hypothetical protein